MIIFLSGKDTYRSHQYLTKMMEKFRAERDPQGMNLVVLSAEKDKGTLLQEIMAAPFLAEKRMVVINGLLEATLPEIQTALQKKVEEQTLPTDVILILRETIDKPKTKAAKALYERLKKEKYAQQFDMLEGAQLTGWIMAEVSARGGEIERTGAHLLSTHAGDSMWRLSGLIDQLVSYAAARNITSDDVALFVEQKSDDNIFNLVDSVVSKDIKNVFAMIQEQYRQGKDAVYVFAMVLRQYRILLELRDLYDRGENLQSASLAKELGLHPFVIKKSLPMVKRYSMEELTKIHGQLLEIDNATKTGRGDQAFMIDMFVGRQSV